MYTHTCVCARLSLNCVHERGKRSQPSFQCQSVGMGSKTQPLNVLKLQRDPYIKAGPQLEAQAVLGRLVFF